MKLYSSIENFFLFLKSLFLQGLFTLLPITATIFFVNFTYKLIIKWLAPLKKFGPSYLQDIPGIEVILFVTVVIFMGLFLKFIFLMPLIHRIESLIAKIPLIRTIYSSAKTVVDFFNVPDPAHEQKKVVLIEYPRKNVYSIAFLLESSKHNFQKLLKQQNGIENQDEVVKVFMPSSPAPTTGYFLLVKRNEIIDTDITFEEAIKAIVSCGLITPESLKKSSP